MVALALERGPLRPVQLRERLEGISSGVLDRHRQQMVALGLLLRRRFKEMPPRVEIALTDAGHELLPIARAGPLGCEAHLGEASVTASETG